MRSFQRVSRGGKGFPLLIQMCPTCFHQMELPESASGTQVVCAACQNRFTVAMSYTPSVRVPGASPSSASSGASAVPSNLEPNSLSAAGTLTAPGTGATSATTSAFRSDIQSGMNPAMPASDAASATPAPPPGLILPPPPGVSSSSSSPAASAGSSSKPTVSGPVTPRGSMTLNATVVQWLPVALFTGLLGLSFFSWVGLFPGGVRAYTQSPWGALTGSFTTDYFSEEVIKLEAPLKKIIRSNFLWMLLYLLSLVAALALSWADRLLGLAAWTVWPPPLRWLETLWPYRPLVLLGLAVALLSILLVQTSLGFGLENAVAQLVQEPAAERLAQADSSTAQQKIVVELGMKLGSYQLQTTTAFALVWWLHIVAILAVAARIWLERRGAKPEPRLVWEW